MLETLIENVDLVGVVLASLAVLTGIKQGLRYLEGTGAMRGRLGTGIRFIRHVLEFFTANDGETEERP